MNTPCYKCEDRVMGCHSSCADYAEYSRKREEIRRIRQEEAAIKRSHREHVKGAISKLFRRHM